MSDINAKQTGFFPTSPASSDSKISPLQKGPLGRNSENRKKELESTKNDSLVAIDRTVKDFSRIKKAVDAVAPLDKSHRVEELKRQINEGTYEIDYDKLAEKIISSEF